MIKVSEHELKESIKADLGRPDNPADFVDDPSQGSNGPDVDSRMRNNFTLRSREDVPAYLRPLEQKATGKNAELAEKKDLFGGDRLKLLEQERFAWHLTENEKQAGVNSVALPTATELLFKKSLRSRQDKKREIEGAIEELYGAGDAPAPKVPDSGAGEDDPDQVDKWLLDASDLGGRGARTHGVPRRASLTSGDESLPAAEDRPGAGRN